MNKSQVIKTKGTKLGKKLEKSLKEAKEGKTNLLYDGKWHDGDMEFDDLEEMMENWRKKEKEKLKKMSPEKRKAFKQFNHAVSVSGGDARHSADHLAVSHAHAGQQCAGGIYLHIFDCLLLCDVRHAGDIKTWAACYLTVP